MLKHAEARRLLDLGFKLCALHPMSKRPVGNGWQLNPVAEIDDNASGYGVPLALNGLCSIDPDNLDHARKGIKRCGFDLEELMSAGVRTTSTRPGSGGRSTFKAPNDLSRVVFASKDPAVGTVLELRAGNSNLQDCLPGTVYNTKDKVSGELLGPYEQQYADANTIDVAPELPPKLLEWWRRLNEDVEFRRQQQALFIGPNANLSVSAGSGKQLAFSSIHRGRYNASHAVTDILEHHGYETHNGERWAPPTASGTPCVRLIPGKTDLWQSDHASDPLLGTFDAWTAHVVLDHDGDVDAANAAEVLAVQTLSEVELNDAALYREDHSQNSNKSQDMGAPGESTGKVHPADTRQDRTDAGNMAILALKVNGNLRWVPELKSWLYWNGGKWTRDEYGTVAQKGAIRVAELYLERADSLLAQIQAGGMSEADGRRTERTADSLRKWATQCRNRSRIENMLALAKVDGRFIVSITKLDQNPYFFGVANGVVDLSTGEFRPAGRDDFVTKSSKVKYDPEAKAPRWEQFISEITSTPGQNGSMQERPALSNYLQRALGYSLTGLTVEHKMFIAVGDGSNGKSVLLDLLQWLIGDYCETIAPEALMASKHEADSERPTPGMRKLAGARLAISSESKDGQKLDVALIKRHTGGGYLTARGMHENAFRFEITHKLWLMTNHKPALDNLDQAMRGRLHLIPFDMRWNRPGMPDRNPNIPDGDKSLTEKLKAEAEGILAWLIKGAVLHHQYGLEPPKEVANMTRTYFDDQDYFTGWYSNAAFYANDLSVPVRHPEEIVRAERPIELVRVDGVYTEASGV